MPNFSHENAKQFWKEFMGGSIYDLINFIEQTEGWTVSQDDQLDDALKKLGTFFDTATSNTTVPKELLLRVCASVYLSQKLRIMQALDTLQPGGATELIQHAEKTADTDPYAQAFLQRNLRFERMRILTRILTPERIQLVQKIYES